MVSPVCQYSVINGNTNESHLTGRLSWMPNSTNADSRGKAQVEAESPQNKKAGMRRPSCWFS
jgi:hypothetical protein